MVEMKGVQENESFMVVRGRYKNLSLAINVWHHSDPREGFFCLPITPMIDPYEISLNKN